MPIRSSLLSKNILRHSVASAILERLLEQATRLGRRVLQRIAHLDSSIQTAWSAKALKMGIDSGLSGKAHGYPMAESTQSSPPAKRKKITGRPFYESLGSPKMILAPMVDQSEFVRFLRHFHYNTRD